MSYCYKTYKAKESLLVVFNSSYGKRKHFFLILIMFEIVLVRVVILAL